MPLLPSVKFRPGSLLVITIIFLAMTLFASVTIFSNIANFTRFGSNQTRTEQAVQLAEAGIDYALFKINQNPNYFLEPPRNGFEAVTGFGPGDYHVQEEVAASGNKLIRVTGFIPKFGSFKQKVTAQVEVEDIGTASGTTYAYVTAALGNALTVVDISDPASPLVVGSNTDPLVNLPFAIKVSGDYAYALVETAPNFIVFDISTPTAPVVVGTALPEFIFQPPRPRALYVSGIYAYVAGMFSREFSIIDISDPTSPNRLGTYSPPVYPFNFGNCGDCMYVSGDYAYVAGPALTIVNISNPLIPTLAGQGSYPSSFVHVSGTHAYVAGGANTFTVVDISNPPTPTTVGSVTDPLLEGAISIDVSGNYAYVAAMQIDALTVVDITDPAIPEVIGSVTDPVLDRTRGVTVSGNYAYVTAEWGDSVTVVDITDPANPFIPNPPLASVSSPLLNGALDVALPSGSVVTSTNPWQIVRGTYIFSSEEVQE